MVSTAETDGPTGPGDDGPLLTVVLLGVGVLGVSLAAPIGAATAAAPALAVAFWRTAMASAVGVPWTLARPRPRAEISGSAGRKAWRHSVIAGAWLAVHFALWMPSLELTSVAAATALVCTTPVWTVAWFRSARTDGATGGLAGVGLAMVGVVVITGVDAAARATRCSVTRWRCAGGMAARRVRAAPARGHESTCPPTRTR